MDLWGTFSYLADEMETKLDKNDILRILYRGYFGNNYLIVEEVGTAYRLGVRYLDYVVMDMSIKRGLHLHGIEMKRSRADWYNELKNPQKGETAMQYCDYFWLLTVGEDIVKEEEIPDRWGWMEIKNGRNVIRKEAKQLDPIPLSRYFFGRLINRASCKLGYVRIDSIKDNFVTVGWDSKKAAVLLEAAKIQHEYDKLLKKLVEYKEETGIDLTR